MISEIIKRNGNIENYNRTKIENAVKKAFLETNELNTDNAAMAADQVIEDIEWELENKDIAPTVETIQDMVIDSLLEQGYKDTAISYAVYRTEHEKKRTSQRINELDKKFNDIIGKGAESQVNKQDGNANIASDSPMGMMLMFGSESAKAYALNYLMKPEFAKAHMEGDIHIHDLDFYPTKTLTCCQIDLEKLFKGGFNTGHGYIREPQSIMSYSSLAAIAIQANQNQQHGGQSINTFDYYMAPGVRKSFNKSLIKELYASLESEFSTKTAIAVTNKLKETKFIEKLNPPLTENRSEIPSIKILDELISYSDSIKRCADMDTISAEEIMSLIEQAYIRAYNDTDRQTYQAMESFVHNLNTLHCLPGSEKIWIMDKKESSRIRLISMEELNDTFEQNRYYALSINKETGASEWKEITASKKQDNKRDLVTIIARNGSKITVTDNHRVMTIGDNLDITEDYPNDIDCVILPRNIEPIDDIQIIHETFGLLDSIPNKDNELEEFNKNFGDRHQKLKKFKNFFVVDVVETIESNSHDEYVYDISVKDNENFMTEQGIFVHNSRAGSQVPFSSINYGTDTSPEGRMVMKNLLLATEAGLGNGETPIFPIQIFKLRKGVSYDPEDPNYDLFKLACHVTAKRLFPNFSFLDTPFNSQFIVEGRPETEATYMGAVTEDDVITIRHNEEIKTLPFKEAYEKYSESDTCEIWDRDKFVKIKLWHKYPDGGDWFDVKFSNGRSLRMTSDHPLPTQRGRVMCEDLHIGDRVPLSHHTFVGNITPEINPYLTGVMIQNGTHNGVIKLTLNEFDVAEYLINNFGGSLINREKATNKPQQDTKTAKSQPYNVCIEDYRNYAQKLYDNKDKTERLLPRDFINWTEDARLELLAGIIDANAVINTHRTTSIWITCENKARALQEVILIESLGFNPKMYKNETENIYRIHFELNKKLPLRCKSKIENVNTCEKIHKENGDDFAYITEIKFIGSTGQQRYDVTTESDMFDVSGIRSHNCRTRVMSNIHGEAITSGRGNLSFTSINLPRLAIKAKLAEPDNENKRIKKFFEMLDEKMYLVKNQLIERMAFQGTATKQNFDFLMGEGVWLDSETLGKNEPLAEVIKHGSLSIGFIGLAETLKALTGFHHGESEDSQKLGLEIVSHMRDLTDQWTQELRLNFGIIGTPAESLSGRFVRIDKEKYGEIKGITDKEWYTNSNHVPVEYKISIYDKINIEAPYHELENAGHISYIELDGDTAKNDEAIMAIVKAEHDAGMGYAAINHPVDRDPVCGYTGIIDNQCPKCGRTEDDGIKFERIRRITGYLVGTTENWCDSKQAEEKARVKHSRYTNIDQSNETTR